EGDPEDAVVIARSPTRKLLGREPELDEANDPVDSRHNKQEDQEHPQPALRAHHGVAEEEQRRELELRADAAKCADYRSVTRVEHLDDDDQREGDDPGRVERRVESLTACKLAKHY